MIFGIGEQKIDVIEWIHKKTDNKIYQRRIKKKVPVKYNKDNDSHFIKYLSQKVPIKHNYLENQNILNVINIEGSLVPLDLDDMKLEITDIDVTTEKREEVMNKVVTSLIRPSVIDQAYKMSEKKKGKKNLIETINTAAEEKKGNLNAKILKLCAMPMDVRSWYVINLKRIAQKGQGFWDRHGNKVFMFIMFMFNIALVYIIFTRGGELAERMATSTVRTTIETMIGELGEALNIQNVTVFQTATTTTSQPTIFGLPIPI